MIDERLSKATNRKELLTKHGYDTKFASHLIRLMLEGKDLLINGKIVFPLPYANTILDIKNGKWNTKQVLDYADEIESELSELVKTSPLPKKPRYKEVHELAIDLIKSFHGWI